ncbi:MAG TPA: hypothetical protein VFI95_17050 [Terriglobales bacterium]|nr:hypothetical protein [Terriglobales bacterium]
MTLLDAKSPDFVRERRRRIIISSVIVAVLILGALVWEFRYWPQEKVVDNFLSALQKQDYERAYGIWMNDPAWKQHANKYANYPYSDFYRDWGPGGEWGLIKTHDVDCALGTKEGTGVIVAATVNGRTEHPFFFVNKADKTLSFSPAEIRCGS